MSGMPNRISGARVLPSKSPSMAAILAGWYCSVLIPWVSPARIWIGATIAAIHIAIENIVRTASVGARCRARSRSRW